MIYSRPKIQFFQKNIFYFFLLIFLIVLFLFNFSFPAQAQNGGDDELPSTGCCVQCIEGMPLTACKIDNPDDVAGCADDWNKAQCERAGGIFLKGQFCSKIKGCLVKPPTVKLEVPILGKTDVEGIIDYIKLVYQWSIAALSILSVVMIMVAGIQWIIAAGSPQAISSAKKRINDALIGLVIALCSFMILKTINPALVQLRPLALPKIKGILHQAPVADKICDPKDEVPCGEIRLEDPDNPSTSEACIGVYCKKKGQICSLDYDDGNYYPKDGCVDKIGLNVYIEDEESGRKMIAFGEAKVDSAKSCGKTKNTFFSFFKSALPYGIPIYGQGKLIAKVIKKFRGEEEVPTVGSGGCDKQCYALFPYKAAFIPFNKSAGKEVPGICCNKKGAKCSPPSHCPAGYIEYDFKKKKGIGTNLFGDNPCNLHVHGKPQFVFCCQKDDEPEIFIKYRIITGGISEVLDKKDTCEKICKENPAPSSECDWDSNKNCGEFSYQRIGGKCVVGQNCPGFGRCEFDSENKIYTCKYE